MRVSSRAYCSLPLAPATYPRNMPVGVRAAETMYTGGREDILWRSGRVCQGSDLGVDGVSRKGASGKQEMLLNNSTAPFFPSVPSGPWTLGTQSYLLHFALSAGRPGHRRRLALSAHTERQSLQAPPARSSPPTLEPPPSLSSAARQNCFAAAFLRTYRHDVTESFFATS